MRNYVDAAISGVVGGFLVGLFSMVLGLCGTFGIKMRDVLAPKILELLVMV